MGGIAGREIDAFLAEIASEAPSPGAGSAAALAMALGLSCARKAIGLTLKHHRNDPRLRTLGEHLAGLSDQAVAGGEADMACFGAYIAAMQRSRDEPDRAEAERRALADLIAVSENLIAIGGEARTKLVAIRSDIYPAMANDVTAALALIDAACAIHAACAAESARAAAALNP